MKKKAMVTFLAALCLAAVPFMENAAVLAAGSDSRTVSEDVKEQLRVYETVSDENTKPERRLVQDFRSILRIYTVPIRYAFAEGQTIEDVLAGSADSCYAVEDADGVLHFYSEELEELHSAAYSVIDGESVELPYIQIPENALQRFQDDSFVKKYIAPDAEPEQVYFLSGTSRHMGTAIYYQTNLGDYVYFYHHSIGEALFPLADFCQYQKALLDQYNGAPETDGEADLAGVTDLSGYALQAVTDVNGDGVFDVMDLIRFQKWLLGVTDVRLSNWESADLCADGTLDIFDLALLKKALVDRPQRALLPNEPIDIGFHDYAAYEAFVHENALEGKLVTYDQISDFGAFLTLSVNAKWKTDGYFRLSYTLDDGSGDTFLLLVNDIGSVQPNATPYVELSGAQVSLSDMRRAGTDAALAYYEANGKRYIYTNGDLAQIVWQDAVHEYKLVGTPKLSEYPAVQGTKLAGLLDLSGSAPVTPPNITDEDYQRVYDRFQADGYVYEITENEITLRPDRKSSIMVYMPYEDMGILYHVNYKDKYYQVYFYNADPDFVQEEQTMLEYIQARLQYTAPICEIDGTSCILTAGDNTLQAFRRIDSGHYYKVRTLYADEAELMEFLEHLQFETSPD